VGQTGELVTDQEASPNGPGVRSGAPLKAAIWLVVITLALGVVAVFVRAPSVEYGGERSAKYRPIRTPRAIEAANRNSISLISESLGGLHGSYSSASTTMVEDAEGTRVGGGDTHRETESKALVLIPRWPCAALVETWGWGTPAGSYRLDVDMISPANLVNYTNPTAARGATVAGVRSDRARIAELFARVLAASDLGGVYDPRALATAAHVGESWKGDGVVSIAVLLPPTARVRKQGSLVVEVGRDWQVESLSVWTDDTFAYQDAVNPQPASWPSSIPLPDLR
jgi:hypothetical protein